MNNQQKEKSYGQGFISFIIERIKKDKGIAAALRRADNPATEYQSWEQFAAFHVELDKPYRLLPHTVISAAIAKAKIEHNGNAGIGCALASCYKEGNENYQAKTKLRRLLACDSVEEVCRILRPILSLIESKPGVTLDFAKLLDQLLKFNLNGQRVKSQWAQDFYSRNTTKVEEVV